MSSDNSANKNDTDNGLPQGTEAPVEIPPNVSEDVYRFWKENGSRIVIYSAVLLIAVLAWQIIGGSLKNRDSKLQAEYASLETTEEKLEFASSHASHGLAGYTYLTVAKDHYEAGEYEKALEAYENANESLEDTEFGGFVALGVGASLLELGKKEEAVLKFEEIARNENFAEGIRAEAMFKRIVEAQEAGEESVVDEYTTMLEAIDQSGRWTQRLRTIKMY